LHVFRSFSVRLRKTLSRNTCRIVHAIRKYTVVKINTFIVQNLKTIGAGTVTHRARILWWYRVITVCNFIIYVTKSRRRPLGEHNLSREKNNTLWIGITVLSDELLFSKFFFRTSIYNDKKHKNRRETFD